MKPDRSVFDKPIFSQIERDWPQVLADAFIRVGHLREGTEERMEAFVDAVESVLRSKYGLLVEEALAVFERLMK
jgi:hypothetical protein